MMFNYFIFLLFAGNLFTCLAESENIASTDQLRIGFVILSQRNDYHNSLADIKRQEILIQTRKLHSTVKVKVWKSHEDFDHIGHWTVFPLFGKLSKYTELDWFFFLEDTSEINVVKVFNIISSYNSSEDVFAGYALRDSEPTIIHHFASCDDDSTLLYPQFSAGFFISSSLIKKLIKKCEDCQFSIDQQYELAKFIWTISSTKLIHISQLRENVRNKNFTASVLGNAPDCGSPVSSEKVYVAVKTCKKFHLDRVKVLKGTWAPDVEKIHIFSDALDSSIPTIKLDVKNVESGHCEKTISILKYYVSNNIPLEWLAIVDDDTLLSFQRLLHLLSCYNSSETIALGERYGFGVAGNYGYNYLTGGSGMIFSLPTIKKLVMHCQCPSIDSPDDMIIGLCLKNLDIPVTHSPLFHQARPVDYSSDFLSNFKHVSFHKHWMIDPYEVYEKWLKENTLLPHHSEL